MLKKTLVIILVLMVLIQLIPIDKVNKPVKANENFVQVFNTPPKIAALLKNACYDCHSNETVYPNYAKIAPISWVIKHHINKGRVHLNFSQWNTFNPYLKKSMINHLVENVKGYDMPLQAYISDHPKANLTKAQRTLLTNYFDDLLKSGKY